MNRDAKLIGFLVLWIVALKKIENPLKSKDLLRFIQIAENIMITPKDLTHIGWLARLELSENDLEKYMPKLNSVLDYFSELDEVNTEGVEPTYHVLALSNVFREDKVREDGSSLTQEEALSNAPKKQDGFFKAPRMM